MAEPVTDGNDYDLHRQLAIVDGVTPISHSISNSDSVSITPFSSPFSLPHGWIIHRVPRSNGPRVDTYYCDPETGRKFRSRKDVERYLTGESIPVRSKSKRPKYNQKMQEFEEVKDNQCPLINVTPTSFLSTSSFTLPDGWIVKQVPWKTGPQIDRVYYEPVTGHKFRSLISVQKHLATQLEENAPLSVVLEHLREKNLSLSKAFKLATPKKNYGSYDSWKKSTSNAPPNKINWVIPSTAEGTWNAFVGDELVPDSMKQQWGKRFMLTISNTKHL